MPHITQVLFIKTPQFEWSISIITHKISSVNMPGDSRIAPTGCFEEIVGRGTPNGFPRGEAGTKFRRDFVTEEECGLGTWILQ
jgi:hypothetical protein